MNFALILRSFGVQISDAEIETATAFIKEAPAVAQDVLQRFAEMEQRNKEMHEMMRALLRVNMGGPAALSHALDADLNRVALSTLDTDYQPGLELEQSNGGSSRSKSDGGNAGTTDAGTDARNAA